MSGKNAVLFLLLLLICVSAMLSYMFPLSKIKSDWSISSGEFEVQVTEPASEMSDGGILEERFLYFEPDQGGWNNLRLGFETCLAIAFATNRTLVLPPKQKIYLLTHPAKNYGFEDIFDLTAVKSVRIITIEELILKHPSNDLALQLRAKKGRGTLKSKEPRSYILDRALDPNWIPGEIFLHIKSKRALTAEQVADSNKRMKAYKKGSRLGKTLTPDEHGAKIIFLPQCSNKPCRMLVQFYSFLFFEDLEEDRALKIFIREELHYTKKIYKTAEGIISRMKNISPSGVFISAHIRHNDFQYKEAKSTPITEIAEILIENIPEHIMQNKPALYIATDEKDKSIFEPLSKVFAIYFLTDFDLEWSRLDIDKNFAGMIEQIVASEGEYFIGSWWSTFTAYIDRVRGYHGLEDKSLFYPKQFAHEMRKWAEPRSLGWWREWPAAWRYKSFPL